MSAIDEKNKPTSAQLAALKNIAAGRSIDHGLTGMSAHGGLWRTWVSLVRRGWVEGDMSAPVLMDAGREALREK